MGNVSTRFTFRNGRTYLTGFPKWPGVHDLNDPIYSGYDTLYIGPKTPDEWEYFIIGPEYPSTLSPKLGVTYHDDDYQLEGGSMLTPGLHVFVGNYDDEGYHELEQDPANIFPSLDSYTTSHPAQNAETMKVLPVLNNHTVVCAFGDMQYDPANNFLPKAEPGFDPPYPVTLILPIGDFTPEMGANKNGYKVSCGSPESVYVYGPDGNRVENKTFYSTVPLLLRSGPRYHFQQALGVGENYYDTCYVFSKVNLTDTAINNPT